MNDKNMKVLTNIIGAVESGGQVYGNRRYEAYAGPYTNSNQALSAPMGAQLNLRLEALEQKQESMKEEKV